MKLVGALTTLTTSWSTTTCSIDDADSVHTAYTTATTTATSSLGGNQNINIQLQAANDYIDSLSVEQLAEFDEIVAQKEAELDLGNGQKAIVPQVKSTSAKTLKKI